MFVQSVENRQFKHIQHPIHVIIIINKLEAAMVKDDQSYQIELPRIEIIIIQIIQIILIVEGHQHLTINRDTCYILYFA